MDEETEGQAYLKLVSRVKHSILAKYLAPWISILGKNNPHLAYIDCFAGRGAYRDSDGTPLPGSPLVALDTATKYVQKHPDKSLLLGFIEKNHGVAERLRKELLERSHALPASISYFVEEQDAQDFTQRLASSIGESRTGRGIPRFFFIDPYGHPISIPIMRDLLTLGKTEILVNLMWFRIAMNLNNPRAAVALDSLFGHGKWRQQDFMRLQGRAKEASFISYLASEVEARYCSYVPFPFSPEDRVQGGQRRKKFFLVHLSNHPKAVLLMKQVMWTAREELDTITCMQQGRLQFGDEHELEDLRRILLERFRGRSVSFDDLQLEMLDQPYIERHYREVLKGMEGNGISICRVESIKGLKGRDIVRFPAA